MSKIERCAMLIGCITLAGTSYLVASNAVDETLRNMGALSTITGLIGSILFSVIE